MAQHKYYNPGSPEGREIEARHQAKLDRLDEEAAPRHTRAEATWGIDSTASDRTMVMSPFNGVLMSAKFFKEHRESPNRHTSPMRDGLAISHVEAPHQPQSQAPIEHALGTLVLAA